MEFVWKYGKNAIEECYFVRKKVFVEEQGFDAESEFDSIDDRAYHLLILIDGKPAATARLFLDDAVYHCGRICILKEFRGTGLGLTLMQKLEEKAVELSAKKLVLSAQTRVSGFYEKAGYKKFGEEYLDEHCPHIAMEKQL